MHTQTRTSTAVQVAGIFMNLRAGREAYMENELMHYKNTNEASVNMYERKIHSKWSKQFLKE